MFDYSSMLKRAIEYFPIWTDIRKRHTKSIGGKAVTSALSETLELEAAIQQYIDFYFLEKYRGKENEVIAFVYAAKTGLIKDFEEITLKYNDKEYVLTGNIDEFYSNSKLAYYEDGTIYLQEHEVNDNKKVTLDMDSHTYTYQLEKTHVWNIFDEFACFVGIERHENENNDSLTKRILYTTKNLPNNTEKGLKHAIISEIMDIDPEITIDDITIEKLTPKNLMKPYKEYNNLLDMLSSMNRDVLKDKRWDLDKWSYDFKSITFLDNVWDDVVEQYQNGIGYKDDLKVFIADDEKTTDADIVLYDKSIEKLEKYVADKHINKNINFKLKRYENILNPINTKYAIKASEAIDITNEEIELSVYESNNRKENRKIEEIYKLGKNIIALDNSKITDNKPYRLEFYSNSNFDNMKISKAKVIYKHKTTGAIVETKNLLKAAPGFTVNASGELVNTSIKKSIRSVNHFNQYENLMDCENGITLAPGKIDGKGIINISGLGLNIVRFEYDHNLVNIPTSLIKKNEYCYWKDNELVFRHDINKERKFEIATEANEISFSVVEGEVDLFVERDGVASYQKLKAPCNWSSLTSDKPSKLKILAVSNHHGPVRFKNFKYSCHTIELKLKYGQMIKEEDGYRLPNFSLNDLIVTMSSTSASVPTLKSIHIGGDTRQLRYKTEIIEPRINMDRIIEISTNGLTNLLHVDAVGNTIYANENYVPATSYKATADDAWIRLDTSQYESIKEITVATGSVHVIEESGKQYYNVVLKNGQTVNSVVIDGVKNTPVRTISLHDMVKCYFKEFNPEEDKIYASKLCKGLIISDEDINNPRTLIVNITSSIFKGIDANMYKFTKIPNFLTTSFNSNDSKIFSTQTVLPFSSISFIPGGAKIYNAVNESYIYTGELRNIKIVNNFYPLMEDNKLMYYEVEPYESNMKYDVRFDDVINSGASFETLLPWSLGLKKIAIKTPIDLSNRENYEISEVEVSDDVLLNRYIELKNSYKISNNNEIFTNRYMVIPPDNCEVLYERYSDKQNSNLIVQEEIIVEEDGFTKLMYSNVDELLYAGFSPFAGKNVINITDYQILKEEGIIIWTNKSHIDAAKKIYLRYTIKNPVAILLNEDELYKAIGYNVNAYDEISRLKLTNIEDGFRFDLKQIPEYHEVDLVYTNCSSPSFQAQGEDSIVTFKKIAQKETILVKTGYYYINGKEYYLFPSKDEIEIKEEKFIDMNNIELSGDEITLMKKTNNYVRNSEMLFRGINELYNFDASKSDIKGVSTINSLTACDNFNNWNTFGMKMYLKDGFNQLGISFTPQIPNGYAYLELTDYLIDGDNHISFWADNTLEVYIGEEKKYLNLDFHDSINIKLNQEIPYRNDPFRNAIIKKENNNRIYLIVKNQGTIDDIILNTDINAISAHTKNIDLLGLKISEGVKSGQNFRMFINSNKHAINKGASLTKEGYIKTASNMYWGISPIAVYDSKEDFDKCSSLNVHIENGYLKTGKTAGYIETAPIFLDNPSTIKRLIFKVNEIGFDNMRGMKVQILSSNTRTGDYMPISSFNDNYGYVYGDSLLRYIKIKITIPENKFINNFSIYSEFKSTKHNAPKVFMPSSGYLLSKIYDTQYSADYKLRNIKIDEISNINDVEIQIRSSKDEYSADVWMPWKTVKLTENLKLKEAISFKDTRFFQVKVLLKTNNAFVKINNLNIEVI